MVVTLKQILKKEKRLPLALAASLIAHRSGICNYCIRYTLVNTY